ncbi:unnamed protein product [Prunus armeniaca]
MDITPIMRYHGSIDRKSEVVGLTGPVERYGKFGHMVDHESSETVLKLLVLSRKDPLRVEFTSDQLMLVYMYDWISRMCDASPDVSVDCSSPATCAMHDLGMWLRINNLRVGLFSLRHILLQNHAFRLKNAEATYQGLVNKIFKKKIGKTIEVYVDDMLLVLKVPHEVESEQVQIWSLIWPILRILSHPKRHRGIETHPNEIKAILNMKSSTITKEIQSLTGRASALNRLLSRSADKYRLFFKALKKGQSEYLFIYLAVSNSAVSSALIREELGAQDLVFYPSKALINAETRYPKIFREKVKTLLPSSSNHRHDIISLVIELAVLLACLLSRLFGLLAYFLHGDTVVILECVALCHREDFCQGLAQSDSQLTV